MKRGRRDRFIDDYPEFRKLGSNVSKHVALVGELSRLVEKRKLLEVSELEQSLASNESHTQDLRVRSQHSSFIVTERELMRVVCECTGGSECDFFGG